MLTELGPYAMLCYTRYMHYLVLLITTAFWNGTLNTPHLVIQSPSHAWLFATPWTAAFHASLSFTISQSLLRLMSIESVMPSNHLIFCQPFLLLPSIFPSIRIFSTEVALCIRWPYRWESWGLEGVNGSLKSPLTSRQSGFRQKPPVPNVTSGPARTWGWKYTS